MATTFPLRLLRTPAGALASDNVDTVAKPHTDGRLLERRSPAAEASAAERLRKFRPAIYWYLSFRCNLACTHCSVYSSPQVDTSGDLTTAQAMGVIDQMAELNVGGANLTGGEMLLRRDALEIIRATADRDIAVGLESNGILFTERFAALARELQERRLFTVAISLDGGTAAAHDAMRGAGSFARTVRGLRLLARSGVRFSVQIVLTRANYPTLPQFYALAAELSPWFDSAQLALLNPIGRGIELMETLGLRQSDIRAILAIVKREKATYTGQTLFKAPPALVPPEYLGLVFKDDRVGSQMSCQFPLLGVLPNGDVTICALSRDNDQLYFGNVLSHNLKKIWEETRMGLLRSRYIAATDLSGICGDCVWKYSCKGGCRAWAFEDGGSFDAALPLCTALVERGEFPRAYRISAQNEAVARALPDLGGACHACSH